MHLNNHPMTKVISLLGLIGLFILSGCATVSPDAGTADVIDTVSMRMQQTPVWYASLEERAQAQERIHLCLQAILTAEDVVNIALMNNPELQSALSEVGIAEADFIQAQRLRNPGYSYSKVPENDGLETEQRVVFDVIGLITMPMRKEIACRHFSKAKLQTAVMILQFIGQTQKAYYETIAAKQYVGYMTQVLEAAKASAELGEKMLKAGNWSRLRQANEQAFYLETKSKWMLAKRNEKKAKEQLIRLMGLSGDEPPLKLPKQLPPLPAAIQDKHTINQLIPSYRLDIQAMRVEVDALCRSLGLTRATRFMNVLDLGYIHGSADPGQPKNGYEISIEIPIFDWGDARIAKSKAMYMQSVWRLQQAIINASSEFREAYEDYRTAFEVAQSYQVEILPLRKRISDENLLRYNGMLNSPFELLADAREQMAMINATIEARRDFWIAVTALETVLMTKL